MTVNMTKTRREALREAYHAAFETVTTDDGADRLLAMYYNATLDSLSPTDAMREMLAMRRACARTMSASLAALDREEPQDETTEPES